jgi:exonuclease SbcD
MRLLHTADWHLGRVFAGFDLLDAQAHALDGLVAIARDARPQAIVIAGDLYDRGVPPEDAVRLFDDALRRLVEVAPVIAIAGNHDSGGRIDFGRGLLRQAGVHLAGTSREGVERVDVHDDHGPVAFHLMPYAVPEQVRFELGRDDLRSHDEATRARIATADLGGTDRHVLVGHLFAQGGRETKDSERDIAVGGVATVDPAAFAPFAYTALGHLHRPHRIGTDRVRYSGSLARYSFAEEDHEKGVSLVELDTAGDVAVRQIPLPQKHGMRTLRGTLEELRSRAAADDRRTLDLVRVVVTDRILVPGSHDALRQLYPQLLEFHHERPPTAAADCVPPVATRRSEGEFLDAFFAVRYPGELDDDVRDLARECLEQAVRHEDSA